MVSRSTPSRFRRVGRWAQDYRWSLISSGIVVAGLLIFIGVDTQSQGSSLPAPSSLPWLWRVTNRAYETLQILGIGSTFLRGYVPWTLGVARWLVVAVAGFTL